MENGDSLVFATTTAPGREEAERIARHLVQRRLAACVQIIESIKSFYWWEGKVQQDEEALLIIKTDKESIPRISEVLAETHPYELPELVAVPIVSGTMKYLEWIKENVRS